MKLLYNAFKLYFTIDKNILLCVPRYEISYSEWISAYGFLAVNITGQKLQLAQSIAR